MRLWNAVLGTVLVAGLSATAARSDELNDYPTSARADYVFGCMKSNGDTRRDDASGRDPVGGAPATGRVRADDVWLVARGSGGRAPVHRERCRPGAADRPGGDRWP